MKSFQDTQFRSPNWDEYEVSVWFERDRRRIALQTPNGREVFSLWDNDVDAAIEDGFLVPPKHPRPRDIDWLRPAYDYAVAAGLIRVPQLAASAPRAARRTSS